MKFLAVWLVLLATQTVLAADLRCNLNRSVSGQAPNVVEFSLSPEKLHHDFWIGDRHFQALTFLSKEGQRLQFVERFENSKWNSLSETLVGKRMGLLTYRLNRSVYFTLWCEAV